MLAKSDYSIVPVEETFKIAVIGKAGNDRDEEEEENDRDQDNEDEDKTW